MSQASTSTFASSAHDLLQAVESKEEDPTVITKLLKKPLLCLGFGAELTEEAPTAREVSRYIPQIQHAILVHVAATWHDVLKETGQDGTLEAYFIPPEHTLPSQGLIAVLAYSSLTALPFNSFASALLSSLVKTFGINVCYNILRAAIDLHPSKRTLLWEGYVRTVLSLPTRMANQQFDMHNPTFRMENYFSHVCQSAHALLQQPDLVNSPGDDWVVFLFEKLILNGLFPSSALRTPTQIAYFQVNGTLRSPKESSDSWGKLLVQCTWSNQQAIVSSLISSIRCPENLFDISEDTNYVVQEGMERLGSVLNDFSTKGNGISTHLHLSLKRFNWNIFWGRVTNLWLVSRLELGLQSVTDYNRLFDQFLEIWTSKEHIEHSLLSQHQSLSTTILLFLYNAPGNEQLANKVSSNPSFISSVGHYISHLDKSVRLCGLLVAEMIAEQSGKQLSFGVWEGNENAQLWAKSTRRLVCDVASSPPNFPTSTHADLELSQPIVAESQNEDLVDSDDSVTGYLSDGSSDAATQLPEDLDAMENDASLRNGAKIKVYRPVYLTQLLGYLRPSASMDAEVAEKQEIGLKVCEDLIRRKRNYGTELAENAAELARALLQAQNSFELEKFDEMRERALTTLIVSEPRIAAPVLIEEYFLQMYSTNQRFVLLNALANGARELAFDEKSISDEVLFPSHLLDGDRHRAYQQDEIKPFINPNPVLAVGRNDSQEKQTNEKTLIRSRQLRVLSLNHKTTPVSQGPRRITFSKVGAEYFIAPFISQFWTYLRENRTRELRTYQASHSYQGSGTGMILNPLMLSQLLRSLATMIHAAQNSPAFLNVLAPEALELNLALSSRSVPLFDHEQIESSAAVLSASMELVLTVLTSCQELDRGRSLCLDNATLLLGVGEWMDQVISQLEAGIRYAGTGGNLETTLIKHALGVASKVSEIASLWRGSMVDIFS